MGIIGFAGAGAGYQAKDLGVINFELIQEMFPAWAVLPFLFMIVSGLLSTVDSNLCAASSLVTDMSGGKELKKTKWAMIALLGVGILIANIPGMTVTHLFLFYGTLRASTLLPTVMTLKGVKFASNGKLEVESKKEMKKRGLDSPDRGDALALSVYLGKIKKYTGSAPNQETSAGLGKSSYWRNK